MIVEVKSLLPLEIWKEIVSYSKPHLTLVACVSKQFTILAKDYPLKGYFGEKEWKSYGGDPGVVFPIPVKMIQDFDPLKQLLTFIPEALNGDLLTLSRIDAFVSKRKGIATSYVSPLSNDNIFDGTVKKYKAHWVMLSKDVLEETRGNYCKFQKKLVKAKGFEIPNLMDAVVSLLMHNLKTGEFVYPNDSEGCRWTLTRVRERSLDDYPIVVGGFSAKGLSVYCSYGNNDIGAACAAQSFDSCSSPKSLWSFFSDTWKKW